MVNSIKKGPGSLNLQVNTILFEEGEVAGINANGLHLKGATD
jgi:hypothetical protein